MKRKSNKGKWYALITIIAVLAVIAAVFGISKSKKDGQQVSKNSSSLTYAFNADPVSLNPINSNDLWGLKTINMIYSPLARTNNDGTVTYELAKSIKQAEDGKSIDVKLRKGIKWSDGKPFTADDVVFTYTQKAKKENGKYESLWIGDKPISVEKVGDYEVKFILPAASAAAVNNLTNETYIIPKHIYKNTSDFSVNDLGVYPTVGTGPYVLKKFTSGSSLTLTANKYYYGGKVNTKKINVRIIENADTLKVALQKGEVDLES